MNSPEAIDLVYGTALAETGLRDIVQESGPALGFWQMEPDTHDDIWKNFLSHENTLKNAIITITRINPLTINKDEDIGIANHPLVWNLRYACIMTRIHYDRQSGEIPKKPGEQAEYWLEHYNKGGKGSVTHYLQAWQAGK